MANITQIIKRRLEAKKLLRDISNEASHVFIIHYSCESFYDTPDGRSARITSIAVRNLASGQTYSFSIHQMAEREKVSFEDIEKEYDQLERKMLEEFFKCVQKHHGYKWVHWNMRDINYGFEAISHRARILGCEPTDIPEGKRFDLARILIDIYGKGYAGHPRLQSVMQLNLISSKDALSGKQEAEAFTSKEYAKLHMSTLRKVDVMGSIFNTASDGTLKTRRYRFRGWPYELAAFVLLLREHWVVTLIGVMCAVVLAVISVIDFLN